MRKEKTGEKFKESKEEWKERKGKEISREA